MQNLVQKLTCQRAMIESSPSRVPAQGCTDTAVVTILSQSCNSTSRFTASIAARGPNELMLMSMENGNQG